MESAINELKSQNDELENKQNELEARSMRENLLFFGFTRSDQEDCSKKNSLFEKNYKLRSPWCSTERIELEKCLEQKLGRS